MITKQQLRFLVEDYLECNDLKLTEKDQETLTAILLRQPPGFSKEEIRRQETVFYGWSLFDKKTHQALKQFWESFKEGLFQHKEELSLKEKKKREHAQSNRSSWKGRDVVVSSPFLMEMKFSVYCLFSSEKALFDKAPLVPWLNLIEILSTTPIDLFAKCGHCGNYFVASRKDKKYCKGCVAKRHQKKLWENDPEGMREREKQRYREKRSKKAKAS